MEWECLNIRWAPHAQLWRQVPVDQVKKAKEREFLHQVPFKVPPKLSWPPPEEVYEYRSFSEAAQILRINSAAEFEINGKRLSEDRMKEIKDRVYELDKMAETVLFESKASLPPPPPPQDWTWFYGPDHLNPLSVENSLSRDLEGGRTRKEFVEAKKEALLAKLKQCCT